jgi:outer membrane receptor protein involved in Fe transport
MPMDIVDPGPDGIPGTGDDQTLTVFQQIADFASPQYIANVDLAKREYKGVELIANKRLSGKWQAMASLVWQDGTGTMGTDFNNSKGWSYAFDDPNKLINVEGPLTLNREWQLKLMGTWLAPAGFFVSGYWSYQTGYPLFRFLPVALNQGTINVIADPKDTWLNDDLSRLDLRVEKVFSLGSRPTELGLILDVFNAFNESGVTARSGNTSDGFNRPLAVQTPRTLRFGARVRF